MCNNFNHMKKILIAIAILKYLLTYHCLSAQITIHDTDLMKLHSTYKMNHAFLSTGIDTGNAGANQVWDYSNLQTVYSDTFKVVSRGSLPISVSLPGNRVLKKANHDGNYEFYSLAYDMLLGYGTILSSTMIIQNKPAEVKLKFPAEYGQTHTGVFRNNYSYYLGDDTSSSFGIDSLRHRTSVNYSYVIDGWGKIITPSGTFDVLRQRAIYRKNDTLDLFVKNINQWIPDYDITEELETRYVYWSNEFYLPLAIMNDFGNTGTIQEASWIHADIKTDIVDISTSVKLKVYPNPAQNILYVDFNLAETLEFCLMDASGKLLKQYSIPKGTTSIDISELASGLYYITIPQDPSVQPIIFMKK